VSSCGNYFLDNFFTGGSKISSAMFGHGKEIGEKAPRHSKNAATQNFFMHAIDGYRLALRTANYAFVSPPWRHNDYRNLAHAALSN
jgi:hypothetical protein